MVDYQAHQPLEEHLAQRFGEQQFDAILDCVGSHALFAKSTKYLKPDGKFVSIVGGWSQGVVPFVRSKVWPRFLGGTPRSFELFLLGASGQRAKEVAAWVEQGVIKEALVDSEYPMEQAVEVCGVKAVVSCFGAPLANPPARHTRNWQPTGPRARLSSTLAAVDSVSEWIWSIMLYR